MKNRLNLWTACRPIGDDKAARIWGDAHADQEQVVSIDVSDAGTVDVKGDKFRPIPIRRAK
jgi:hypothetical protein